ncbi:F0F1 ATP synthase subunit A [Neptunicella marina]|uniref:ATP synthase subunit a n=1 Tax=Neptunicella marina TaxID=2125989 RepID=A0A8J6IS90_9ALTE|nr:F0F1 ATP synthase subunit A [Neptunicella marina]MBC3764458.1 F0F1 ATP synthase subunit A [Neptunicella marina]
MHLSPDDIIFWQYGIIKLNATIVFTWVLMLVLTLGAKLITRNLTGQLNRSRWQNLLEIIVTSIEQQIKSIGLRHPRRYIGFLGSLFLFVACANLFTLFPGYEPPTGSLSTTLALALCVFLAVPIYGIYQKGIFNYLASYTEPVWMMLPFNIIGELSRTLALAVRLFGNVMSGSMIMAILLVISPYIFPLVMTALGLLTGMVQAYIFFVLAAVYIAAATQTSAGQSKPVANSSVQLHSPTKK